jgi:hypothetical protein
MNRPQFVTFMDVVSHRANATRDRNCLILPASRDSRRSNSLRRARYRMHSGFFGLTDESDRIVFLTASHAKAQDEG